jgi:O-antigen/teichoic acid export membrane protein
MALAIEGMLLPAISSLHASKKENEIRTLVHDAERYVAMVCIPVVVMTVVWSSEIILVFISKEFIPASNILKILALVALVKVLNRPWSVALRGSDRPDLTSILSIVCSILSIILMLILVPKKIPPLGLENLFGLGGEGAAYAVLISEITMGLSLRILCYWYLDILPKKNFFVQISVASLVGIIMWQVQGVIVVDRWFELFFLSGLGGLLFVCILSMFGSFTQKDFNFYWNTLNPKSMGKYVGEELKRDS